MTRRRASVLPRAFQRCARSSPGTNSRPGTSRVSGATHGSRRRRKARKSASRITRTGASRSLGIM
eukprot:6251905-Pyramimonas_sp.AAC.1